MNDPVCPCFETLKDGDLCFVVFDVAVHVCVFRGRHPMDDARGGKWDCTYIQHLGDDYSHPVDTHLIHAHYRCAYAAWREVKKAQMKKLIEMGFLYERHG